MAPCVTARLGQSRLVAPLQISHLDTVASGTMYRVAMKDLPLVSKIKNYVGQMSNGLEVRTQ